jgi:hypothetical protein
MTKVGPLDKRYFVSTVSVRFDLNMRRNDINHHLHTYDHSNSEDEARGRVVVWLGENFPQNEGWTHHVNILPALAPNPSIPD